MEGFWGITCKLCCVKTVTLSVNQPKPYLVVGGGHWAKGWVSQDMLVIHSREHIPLTLLISFQLLFYFIFLGLMAFFVPKFYTFLKEIR